MDYKGKHYDLGSLLESERQAHQRLRVQIPDAPERLRSVLGAVLGARGKRMDWLPEYDQVGQWLEDNVGRGLLLQGGCGIGKTLIATRVIPLLVRECYSWGVYVYTAQEMRASIHEEGISPSILQRRYLCIDDIGTEATAVRYGDRREALPEILDSAEREGKLLIMTTNLSTPQLLERYGDRALDRLLGLCRVVTFAPTHSRRL